MFIYYELESSRKQQTIAQNKPHKIFKHWSGTDSAGILISDNIQSIDSSANEIIYWNKNSLRESDLNIDKLDQCKTQSDFEQTMNKNLGWDSFILYSRSLQQLVIAQNHTAFPDLYYYSDQDLLIVSDNLDLLRQNPIVKIDQINPKAIYQLLYFYFITKSESIFQKVQKVAPGEIIFVDNFLLKKINYWSPDFNKINLKYEETVARWGGLIESAVKCRLSDLDMYSLFLSGGIDSSLISFFLHETGKKPINGFTTGIKDSDHDETELARISANEFNLKHKIDYIGHEVMALLPEIMWHSQEPYADRSLLGMYNLGKYVTPDTKSIITGDGEGIGMQYSAKRWQTLAYQQIFPGILREKLLPSLADIIKKTPLSILFKDFKTKSRYGHPDFMHIFHDGGTFNLYEIGQLVGKNINFETDLVDFNNIFYSSNDLDQLQLIGLYTFCYSDYLKRSAIFQSRYQTVVETPFMDKNIIEFMSQVPFDQKYSKRDIKPITRAVAHKYLPNRIVNAKKRGWYIPAIEWLHSNYQQTIIDYISKDLAGRGIFDPMVLKKLTDQFIKEKKQGYKIMMLLFLETWFKIFMDRSIGPNDRLPG